MIISIYRQEAYKEYCLPNRDNIDHSILLEKELFSLEKRNFIHFENTEGVWFIRPEHRQVFSKTADESRKIKIADGDIIEYVQKNGDNIRIIASKGQNVLKAYKVFDLSQCGKFTVGSNENCDIVFSYGGFVSSQHCSFYQTRSSWYVHDTSTNGVFVNSKRIMTDVLLGFGDTVDIFGIELIFLGNVVAVNSRIGDFNINQGGLSELFHAADAPHLVREEAKLFNRSPRTIDHIYDDEIEIESPPAMQVTKKAPLLQTIGPSFTMALPMLAGCLIAAFGSGRSGGAYMYTGIVTALGSALLGAFWGYKNIKAARLNEQLEENERFNTYSDYLIKMANEIQEKYINNVNAMIKTYPSASDLCKMDQSSAELWNRNFTHKDFLFQRLGVGEKPFQCKLKVSKEKFSINYDSLQEKPALLETQYKMLHDVPVGIDMQKNRLFGIVGGANKRGAVDVVYNIAAQIAANNCYTDVKMVLTYNGKTPDDEKKWNFFRWFPHIYSENKKLRFIASDKLQAADIFFEIAETIRQRLDQQESHENKNAPVRPHFILFIEDMELLEGEPIAKYLLQNENTYGITTFIISDYYYNLPNNCENIIQNDEYGSFIYNAMDTENQKQKFTMDKISAKELESFAKNISEIKVAETESDSEIPTSLTFMDMFRVSTVEELNIAERWRKNRTYNTMKALVGQKAGGADCYLDIHEKYHGPHGLVAGTTGSGKSETLQTYILSLAIEFSPDDVAFFIIDFKGGGMANLFSDLPHMVGQISNLSGNQINRAMVSIKSEIKRRQMIFSEKSVNNINSYTNLYKEKEATVAVPHLLIVIDEFAEMKREEPEFMRELISVAQVGRSLGIHLILATQKPGGTVDDNIWSNTKFRLCLRVQSRGDSMDMLHRPDAAYITQAGRCYLQVGNNEIFEFFQSGWSGAVYDPDNDKTGTAAVSMLTLNGKAAIIGNRLKTKKIRRKKHKWLCDVISEFAYEITKQGGDPRDIDHIQPDDIAADVVSRLREKGWRYNENAADRSQMEDFFRRLKDRYSDITNAERIADEILDANVKFPEIKETTQLDTVVEYLGKVAKSGGYESTMSLWLPPLKDYIRLDELEGYGDRAYHDGKWNDTESHWSLEAMVGLCDDPENQDQIPFTVDFALNGHCAVIGSVVSGKSTFTQTLMYSLCSRYSPEQLNIYLMDFSSQALSPFEKAPHCGGIFYESDIEQIGKLFNMMSKITEQRKKTFKGGNYAQYVKAHGTEFPAIIIAIDNYAAFAEKTEGKFDHAIMQLSREGAGYGMYLFLSAQGFGMNEIPNRIADNLGCVTALSLADKFKYMDVLRTTSLPILPESNIRGRGLAKVNDRFLEFQAAVCVDAEDDYERLKKLQECFEDMSKNWSGKLAPKVPVIPEKPTLTIIKEDQDYQYASKQPNLLPFAYRLSDASIYSLDLRYTYCYTVSGKNNIGKTNTLKMLLSAASQKNGNIIVYEHGTDELLAECQNANGTHITSAGQLFEFLSGIMSEFAARNKRKKELVAQGCDENELFEKMQSFKPYFIFINDINSFFNDVYFPGEGVGAMSGFVENIIEKGASHNFYFFAAADSEKSFDVSGTKAYSAFIGYKKGVLLGGCINTQQTFSFRNMTYSEQSRPEKRGIGITPSYEDESVAEKIVIPVGR